MLLDNSELGKKSAYKDQYDPSLLFPIPRQTKRDEIHISKDYQFEGCDIWNAFEVSWLNSKGKPVVRIMQFRIDANSLNIIESKSFKSQKSVIQRQVFKIGISSEIWDNIVTLVDTRTYSS